MSVVCYSDMIQIHCISETDTEISIEIDTIPQIKQNISIDL